MKVDDEQKVFDFLRTIQQDIIDMSQFQLASLKHIKELGANAEAACRSAMAVTVNPYMDSEIVHKQIGLRFHAAERVHYLTYPFMLTCSLTVDGVEASAWFDKSIFRPDGVFGLLYGFESVLKQLVTANVAHRLHDIGVVLVEERELYC